MKSFKTVIIPLTAVYDVPGNGSVPGDAITVNGERLYICRRLPDRLCVKVSRSWLVAWIHRIAWKLRFSKLALRLTLDVAEVKIWLRERGIYKWTSK